MKKLISLVLALAMVLMVGASFAAEPAAKSISLSGLEAGDTVKYYKVIEWNDTEGWKFTEQFSTLSAEDLAEIVGHEVTDAETGAKSMVAGKINSAMAAKIAAKAVTAIGEPDNQTGTEWSKSNQEPGLYMVQAASSKDTIYNPVFLAVQADGAGSALTLPLNYADNGQVKKSSVTIEKVAKKQGGEWKESLVHNVGDIIDFKITTTVPVYNATYTNPVFKISDTMTNGLTRAIGEGGALGAITVKVGETALDAANYEIPNDTNTATGFVINFKNDYLTTITTAQTVVVTYQAKITDDALTVNEETNTAEIEFSRNPQDENDHGKKEDKTTHYTFDIDAGVTGNESYISSELIKVAVDQAGNPILEEKTYSNTTKHHPLAGAEFKLYKADGTTPYTNDTIKADTVFTSSDMGLLNIKGLDEGTYVLKETKPATGFMLLTDSVTFQITATYKDVAATDTCNAYKVLDTYTVSVNGGSSSTYTFDQGTVKFNNGVTTDNSTEIKNTQGTSLPSTGGIGTTIFYIVGGLLLVGAAIVLVARRKASEN